MGKKKKNEQGDHNAVFVFFSRGKGIGGEEKEK